MTVNECAEILRSKGYTEYCWKPKENSAEPDIVARKNGRFYNVYLYRDNAREEAINEFAKERGAKVIFMSQS